ncbi:MAG: terminase family protein [Oscillospiraceae bacterium]|nr:terminase family protein [Oscillospiraceae bacterium]
MTTTTRSVTYSHSEMLMGSQEPSVRIVPSYQATDGPDACAVLRAGGLKLDPWQMDVLDDWLGRTPGGRWSSPACGGSVPRQNGKTLLVQGRMEAGMILFNEQVIYTAHLQKTATETFEEMRDYFEHPKVRPYVAEIKTAIGREQIILKSGARVKFLARTRNGGRGQHGDLLVFDEAQELDENQQGSFLPAISASLNPQTIYVGTPPDPSATGTVFRSVREKAKESQRTAWFEFSVPEIGNVRDHARWAATNPALGRRILFSTIEGEVEQMEADTFARERLGWWSPIAVEKVEYALDKEAWAACASEEQKPEGKTAYGIKFSADGSEVCLCGAVCPAEGKARISLIERKPTGLGTRWLADWLNERYNKASCVVIDGRNGVDVLVDRIADTWKAKGSVIRPSARDMVASVGQLTNEISEKTVTWYKPQAALDESATSAVKRSLAGGWAFGGSDSAPIEACALALWGARNSKRDPTRQMRIG